MKSKKQLLQIFAAFLKIGTFTFGGGYTMIPLIEHQFIEKYKWVEKKELLDILAVSQITPGVIAVNAATYVGYRIAGFAGAFWATLGVIIPSFASIYLITFVLHSFGNLDLVQAAFRGIRIGVIITMAYAVWKLIGLDKINLFYVLILGGTIVLATLLDINIVFITLGAIGIGLLYAHLSMRREKGGQP